MNFMEERIVKDGIVKAGNVLKVDSFLNHQMDVEIMDELGREFKRRFGNEKITKILTIETSGIAIACSVAREFGVPMVFAKKNKSINIDGDMYVVEVESFTHKDTNNVIVAKKFLFVPVMKIIVTRQEEIDSMYTQADTARETAEKLQSEYEEKLSQAAETSERLVKEATIRAQGREEEIIREANIRAEAILTKASADIAQEKKKALNDAKDEISVIALAIAGKVVGRELKADDQSKLVDSFIEELGE